MTLIFLAGVTRRMELPSIKMRKFTGGWCGLTGRLVGERLEV